MPYLCNVDTGGTHTDAAVINEEGRIVEAKTPSTPEDFSKGFFNALGRAATKLNLGAEELLEETELVSHGTTVGTNAIIEGEGVKASFVTTRGAEDVLFLMRGALGRGSGLTIEELLHYHTASKPDPIIPEELVFGIDERIDCMGDVIVNFNEEQAREVATTLKERDVDAVGINFLWSFLNEEHEERMASILQEELDDVFITQSNKLIPKWGEYERSVAVAINSSIGPITADYIDRIDKGLDERGYDGTLLVMLAGGGVASAEKATREPVRTIDSGPAAGMIGCNYLANLLKDENIIAADMGGTSFDVGLIVDGKPLTEPTNVINQYDYAIRNIDIESIGSGGGSIAWIEEDTGRLEVGPKSAGANPGPACYGQGGKDATITDADLLLGFLDPENFLGGREVLDRNLAEEAVGALASEQDMDVLETAAGIVEIANAKMADAVSQRTINKGYDPRRFAMYAYGGAGPIHMPLIADQLDIGTVVVPGGRASAVWSAFGISSSDLLHREEVSNIRTVAPFDPSEVTEKLTELETKVRNELYDEGFKDEDIRLNRFVNLGYAMQVHELTVPVPNGTLTQEDVDDIITKFESQYEDLYGEGAGASESGFELSAYRVDGYGSTTDPKLELPKSADNMTAAGTEEVLWPGEGQYRDTKVYYQKDIDPESEFRGPSVVRLDNTTVAVPAGSSCTIDQYGNFKIRTQGDRNA